MWLGQLYPAPALHFAFAKAGTLPPQRVRGKVPFNRAQQQASRKRAVLWLVGRSNKCAGRLSCLRQTPPRTNSLPPSQRARLKFSLRECLRQAVAVGVFFSALLIIFGKCQGCTKRAARALDTPNFLKWPREKTARKEEKENDH